MHKYACEVSLSLDAACRRLDIDEIDYIVEDEHTLKFPAEPNDQVLLILLQYGFEQIPNEVEPVKLPMTWSFAFDYGTKQRDECSREELLYIIDHLFDQLKHCRESSRRQAMSLFTCR